MQISLILAHPSEESFNHAIAMAAVDTLKDNGHTVICHDLYKEKFDPILLTEEFSKNAELPSVIQQHCDEIANADGIIIVHPNWSGQPPAILKGWIDRVIKPGVGYEFEGEDGAIGTPKGLLKAKTAMVFNTSDTPTIVERDILGDTLESIWKNYVFGLCGIKDFHRRER
jgi:putative NADPH-quinone reductase